MNRSQKKRKTAIMILGFLLLLRLAAQAAVPNALAVQMEQGTGSSASSSTESNETTILLYNRNPDDNTPFSAQNMFPGDVITKDYRVHVSYKADVTAKFHVDIREGYEKLAEVMLCKVELLTTGETVYEGLMRDFPESWDHILETNSKTTTELKYRIAAYLDTGVGNEYQNQELVADFQWWVEEDENLSDNPDTGDRFNHMVIFGIMIGSAFVFSLLFAARKKEGNDAK